MKADELEWVRKQLAKLLGIKRYPDEPWGTLLTNCGDLINTADTPQMLLEEVETSARLAHENHELGLRKGLARRQGLPRERSGGGKKAPARLGKHEVERSRIFSECLARQAATFSGVKDFRVKYLDDELLSSQQARELLASPVAAHWPRMSFEVVGMSIVKHAYQVVENMSDERGPYSLVEVSLPSSKVASIRDRRPLAPGPWEIPDKPESATKNREQERELKPWKVLPFPGADGYTHRVLVRPQSVLGKLHDEVSRLIQRYPWEEAQATWFVLTGETPWVAPLTWQFRATGAGADYWNYGFITLKIEPWVPADLVQQVYSDVQRRLRGGHRARPVEAKSLELLRFVNREVGLANLAALPLKERRRLAPKLVAVWDQQNPTETYGSNTWRFWRDLHRVRRSVVSPAYQTHYDRE